MTKWKPVVVYHRKGIPEDVFSKSYEVSALGGVRQIDHAQITEKNKGKHYEENDKTLNDNGQGYFQVTLYGLDGLKLISFSLLVHRLVAFAFLGKPPLPSTQVNHLDLNRGNNRLENLTYCTHEENLTHSVVERLKGGGPYRKGYFAALSLLPEKMKERNRLEFSKGMEQGARYCKVNSARKIKDMIKKVERG
jgi:hypothetical protein